MAFSNTFAKIFGGGEMSLALFHFLYLFILFILLHVWIGEQNKAESARYICSQINVDRRDVFNVLSGASNFERSKGVGIAFVVMLWLYAGVRLLRAYNER